MNNNYFLEELSDANGKGFTHDFILLSDGLLYCNANGKKYKINEINIQAVPCSISAATLYLIETKDQSLKGTLAEYWESY